MKVNKGANNKQLPCELYIDGYLKKNLDLTYKQVKNDWDSVALYSGREGAGKTVKAMQDALYLNPNFNIDNIVFNARQFKEAVENAEPFSVIMWDESDELAKNWQSHVVQAMTRYFKRIRSKNLFFLLVTPTLFDMNKYFVMHRLNYCIQVYADKGERGYFKFFNQKRIRKLFVDGKKYWDWSRGNPNFIARFTKLPKGFPIDWDAYNEKKDVATEEMAMQANTPKGAELKQRRDVVRRHDKLKLNSKKYTLQDQQLAELFNVDPGTISKDRHYIYDE